MVKIENASGAQHLQTFHDSGHGIGRMVQRIANVDEVDAPFGIERGEEFYHACFQSHAV